MKLLRLETDLLRVPLKRPVSLPALQEPRPASTVDVVLVRAITDGPHVGLGFAYVLGGGATAVRALIKQLVTAEDAKKPLSDSQLASMLEEQGIQVARRTVAKYREALKIAPANLRKAL